MVRRGVQEWARDAFFSLSEKLDTFGFFIPSFSIRFHLAGKGGIYHNGNNGSDQASVPTRSVFLV